MPSQANITVKKADNTTDIIYAAISAASGMGQWAVWRQDAANSNPLGLRPELWMRTRNQGNPLLKILDLAYKYPVVYTETTTSQVKSAGFLMAKTEIIVPYTLALSQVSEGVYQGLSLLGSAHIKDNVNNVSAPT